MKKFFVSRVYILSLCCIILSCVAEEEPRYEPVFDCDGDVYPRDVTLRNQEDVNAFGLCGCTEINGDLRISNVFGTRIYDLSPLSTLTKVDILSINGITDINSWTGLENLTDVFFLGIYGSHLESFEGLQNIRAHHFEIYGNQNLTTIDHLVIDSDTIGSLELQYSPLIDDLSFLSGVTTIENNLYIHDTGITDFEDLSNLESIGILDQNEVNLVSEGFSIKNNSNLTSLNGLDNLLSLYIDLTVIDNLNLTDYCGLEPLITSGSFFGEINIIGNPYNPNTSDFLGGRCNDED